MRPLALALAGWLVAGGTATAFQRETTNDPACPEAPGVNCPHLGTPLQWRRFPVGFFVDPEFAGIPFGTVIEIAESSFATWESASEEGITFRLEGTAAVSGPDGEDGRNVVFFRPFPTGQQTFAQSILTFDSETGEIFDVDVELNSNFQFAVLPSGQNDPSDSRVDLRAVLTHEVGHLLGLDHENRFGPAVVMYFSDTSGNASHRNLTSDDRAGVRAIYPVPAGESPDGGGGGGGGCEVAERPSADRALLFAIVAGLGWAATHRGRKRRR